MQYDFSFMIHLQKYSSLLDAAAGLAAVLEQHQPADPLVEQSVIVPNMDTARWLKLELAEIRGISANLTMVLPSDWQYRQIRKLYPDLPKKLPSDILPMTWSLFELLSNVKSVKDYPLLSEYVMRQSSSGREAAAWQLASQIASVFDQYLVYRPEMLLSWQSGNAGKSADEQWQAKLWNQLNSRWRSLSDPDYHLNRAELHRDLIKALQNGKADCNDPLFIFNPGLVPAPILQSIKLYSDIQDVLFLYSSPIQSEISKQEQILNPLLDSFGKEAMDLEQLYNTCLGKAKTVVSKVKAGTGGRDVEEEQLNLTFDANTVVSDGLQIDSDLNRIQHSILKNEPLLPGNEVNGSIRIHSCHSPLREVETLYHFLLEMFEEDNSLNPDDILVTTPDPQRYEPFIKAVFGTTEDGLPDIPWHLGSNRNRENRVEKCLRMWLELPDSRFRVQPVMDLFSMQPVYSEAGISESDVHEVREWIAENNVMWGLDADHRQEMGQPPSVAQTWHSAMKRGWLGQLMADEPGRFYEDTLLFSGIRTTSQKETWAAFSQFLNRLDQTRQETQSPRTGVDWCDWIEKHLMELIGQESLAQQDGLTVREVLDRVRKSCETVENQTGITFSMIRSVIIAMLDQKGSSGALFTRGVTFSSMVPVRSIPFRVIALIGLNEGSFPRKEMAIDFDLMAQQPRIGERNRKHEDRNLFLESILSASDVHYLSYVGQSPLDNDDIPASTIVTEWIDQVSVVSGREHEKVVQNEALHLFSESNFIEKRVYSGLALQTAANLKKQNHNSSGLILDLKKESTEEAGHEITLDRIVRFFKNPIRSYVTDHLGAWLRNPEEEKDEFSLSHLERHLIFQQMMGWLISGRDENEILRLIRKAGLVPDGWAGESLISELLANCKTALNFLRNRGEDPKYSELDINVQAGDVIFNEAMRSFRDQSLLEIESSRLNGAMLIQSWIRHVAWQVSSEVSTTSNLLSELKSGEPKWVAFKPAENPGEILNKIVSLYQKGQSEPLLFFPKSLYTYLEAQENKKNDDPLWAAANEFEGSDYSFGERSDLSIQMILGPEASFDKDYLNEELLSVINVMADHMEVK